ncbi:ETEC_3214 domain-containing protein [Vibrio palustris]|uniref:Uncharacterized protein n=1 Tax=Vibrio palustris TaxID=1918946 RepID=A0A1R4B3L0_9VIBR|nr:ETEC_3214 domain-containing protein [Vibrio palustris]SJL83504.1 hypothetical protein VPAL9027_01472 [Vibrio palustris]
MTSPHQKNAQPKKEVAIGDFTLNVSNTWAHVITTISLVIIALGNFNDSSDALEKLYNFSLAQFTTIPSQNKLDTLYIRASAETLSSTFGEPVYLKQSYKGDKIRYYRDENFILSAITRDQAIVAYLVFPLHGFIPNTHAHAGGDDLLATSFTQQETVKQFAATHARTIRYYLESNASGEFSNLYDSIAGYSTFDQTMTNTARTALVALSDAQVFASSTATALHTLRHALTPNFFGYSTLGLKEIEDAILTQSEFHLISQ